MRLLYLLNFSLTLFLLNNSYSQPNTKKNNFVINGQISGKDTGRVILWYTDMENYFHRDTVYLKNEKFIITGNTNIACEALLWTDITNNIFDNKSMLRFILEPGQISISCKIDDAIHAKVKGLTSQNEKQKWDTKKADLTAIENQIRKTADSLYRMNKINENTAYKIQSNVLNKQLEENRYRIRIMDFSYISKHRNSYLSGYLLSHHKRRLSIDSLQTFYATLTTKVKNSNLGYDVLSYLYPLTNDSAFRNKNPIFGLDFNNRLKKIKSIYDISIPDTSGKLISLSNFKGQYLIIDFWASWCAPCLANIPFIKKLKEDYKNDPIQIISVSVDTKTANWKNAIKKYNFGGTQLSELNGFYGLLTVYCKEAIGVPRYMLFDKNGKLINPDLPQPGEPELNKILQDLLK